MSCRYLLRVTPLVTWGLTAVQAFAGLWLLSAGIVADSGWRLGCWFSDPAHVISAHALAIVAMAGAGALAGVLVDRTRWR